jgi:hypothetical protein
LCGQTGCPPIGLSELLEEVEKVCSKPGIDIEVGDDQRVYRVGVKLGEISLGSIAWEAFLLLPTCLAISKRWLSSFITSEGLRTSSRVDQNAVSTVVCTRGTGGKLLSRRSALKRRRCVPILFDRR